MENIYTHRKKNMNKHEATEIGVQTTKTSQWHRRDAQNEDGKKSEFIRCERRKTSDLSQKNPHPNRTIERDRKRNAKKRTTKVYLLFFFSKKLDLILNSRFEMRRTFLSHKRAYILRILYTYHTKRVLFFCFYLILSSPFSFMWFHLLDAHSMSMFVDDAEHIDFGNR